MNTTPQRTALRAILILICAVSSALADNATDRVRRHEARMSYLDNGAVRLGVDLNVGGAITYLSRSGTDQNLVNSYDFGRQIQMSYYSGPVPFSVDGKDPKPEWKQIGWNPIQVGDAFGNGSKVLESRNDGKAIYVKCIPMHWPLNDVPGECTFECWFTLDGAAVHARSRIVNHRPDRTQYPARRQELPAIYTNGPWCRLISYTGDKPFTGDAVTELLKKPGGPGPWRSWIGTESWAALVDKDNFGLGIWIPGVFEFGGGFAGKPGTGGPHDNPTGYIAPHPNEIIDWNIEHEYHYDLIVGTLGQIRGYAESHTKPLSPPDYHFEKDRQGWIYTNANDAGWPIKGELRVSLDRNDPQLIGPVSLWKAADAGIVVIEAASHAGRTDAQLFWQRFDEQTFSEAKSVHFPLIDDGAYHTYRIPVSNNAQWKGSITQLRFDPVGAGSPGAWINIKRIAVER